jgi:hypothetical protein
MIPIQQTIQSILQTLQSMQRSDGAFPSSSSAIFGSALIAGILAELSPAYPTAQDICVKLVAYLTTQERSDGSFSYWEQGSKEDHTNPYPPDLDDTALVAAAIQQIDPTQCDGAFLARFVKILTAAEIAEGGPYNTWLIDIENDNRWKDIDLGVNANIAYALSLVSIQLPSLEQLCDEAITTKTYQSRYYHLPLMLLFFISRGYHGANKEKAIKDILGLRHEDGTWGTYTETALALCALTNFGTSIASQTKAVLALTAALGNELPLDPLYRELVHTDNVTFYTNRAVTQSLIAVALHRFAREAAQQPNNDEQKYSTDQIHDFEQAVLADCIAQCTAVSASFGDLAKAHADALFAEPISAQAIALPFLFQHILIPQKKSIPETVIHTLGCAQFFGWIGYKIIDSIMDGESGPSNLPFATYCIRSFQQQYQNLFLGAAGTRLLEIIDGTERAFAQEYQNRIPLQDGRYYIRPLPEHTPITWQKSLGHALPVLALLLQSGYDHTSAEYVSTLTFFQSFLHARQLHDDAHDFIEDLGRGHITVIGKQILEHFAKHYPERDYYVLSEDEQAFRNIFWQDCFPSVHQMIDAAIADARTQLKSMPISNTSYLETLLNGISSAQRTAQCERTRMFEFLTAY